MSTKDLKSDNTGPPKGTNRKAKEGMLFVTYKGSQPEKYVPANGIMFTLKKGEPKELPADIVENLITQRDFEGGK